MGLSETRLIGMSLREVSLEDATIQYPCCFLHGSLGNQDIIKDFISSEEPEEEIEGVLKGD